MDSNFINEIHNNGQNGINKTFLTRQNLDKRTANKRRLEELAKNKQNASLPQLESSLPQVVSPQQIPENLPSILPVESSQPAAPISVPPISAPPRSRPAGLVQNIDADDAVEFNNIYQNPEEVDNSHSILGNIISGINPMMNNVSTNSSMPFIPIEDVFIKNYDENWEKITDHLTKNTQSDGVIKSIESLRNSLNAENTSQHSFYNSIIKTITAATTEIKRIIAKVHDIFELLKHLNNSLGGPNETTENAKKIQDLLGIINSYILEFNKIEDLYKKLSDTDEAGNEMAIHAGTELTREIAKLSSLFSDYYFDTIGIFNFSSDANKPQLYTYNQIKIAAKKSNNTAFKRQFDPPYSRAIYGKTKDYIDQNKQMIIYALNAAGIPNWDGYTRPALSGGRNKTKCTKTLKVKGRSKRKHRLSKRTQVYKRKQRFSKRRKGKAFRSKKA